MPSLLLSVYRLLFLTLLSSALLALLACGSSGFPALGSGTYSGKINGLIQGSTADFSMYAEALDNNNTLLLVVFAEGWTPQMLRFKGGATPLILTHEGVTYTLRGSAHSGDLAGTLSGTNGVKGNWELHPVSAVDLKRDIDVSAPDFDMEEWLKAKARYNLIADEISSLRIAHEQEAGKYEKLERFVKNENVLRDRSKSRKDALASELNKITEQRKKSTNDLKNALNDLALINRSTKEGQLVELNRRIGRRENKWYAINWAGSGVDTNAEEQLAAEDQVDLKKLNAAVRKAEEIQKLQHSIEEEQQKIHQLESQSQSSIRVIERPQIPERSNPPQEERPWWKVWDNR